MTRRAGCDARQGKVVIGRPRVAQAVVPINRRAERAERARASARSAAGLVPAKGVAAFRWPAPAAMRSARSRAARSTRRSGSTDSAPQTAAKARAGTVDRTGLSLSEPRHPHRRSCKRPRRPRRPGRTGRRRRARTRAPVRSARSPGRRAMRRTGSAGSGAGGASRELYRSRRLRYGGASARTRCPRRGGALGGLRRACVYSGASGSAMQRVTIGGRSPTCSARRRSRSAMSETVKRSKRRRCSTHVSSTKISM